jgi:glycosyltransferase involved in cell wall biosynthesis
MDKKLLIYMPALNEQETIASVLKSIPDSFKEFKHVELLVVNDGSTDNTEIEAKSSGATVLNHNKNRGVGEAFQTAINYALKINAHVLVSIDADGQFDVNQIPEMINPILTGKADFSIGVRFKNGKPNNMPIIKYWGNKQVNKIVSFVSNNKIYDASCGFRAYSNNCLLSLNLHGSFTYTHETILDLLDKGYKVEQIPVKVKYFEHRVSRVANNLFNYTFKTSAIIFKSLKDYKPLEFFLNIALLVFIIGMLFGCWTFIHWLVNNTITPYKSFGIFGIALIGMSLLITIFAFMADMLGRIRKNQEKILFLLKKTHFENPDR